MTSTSLSLDAPPRPRRRWLAVVALAGLALVGLLVWRARSSGEEGTQPRSTAAGAPGARAGGAESRPVPVVTMAAARRDVPVFLEGLGTVTAYKTVTVRSRVDGQLQSVAFREGQDVKQGTVLAQVDPRAFQIQLHTAEAALARDGANLKGARLNLERYEGVRKDKLIAQQQVDDQRTAVEQLEATIKADEAQIENARLLLDYARITSPIDGVTGVRLVDPGNMVHASDAGGIVIVTQLDPIAVLFTLPQDNLQAIAGEMSKGRLPVVATSRDGQKDLARGQLELIDNQINATTSTIRLKAIFPNPTKVLWPNQFVKARLLLATKQGVLVVPAVALQRGPKGTFVYVVSADNKAQVRNVDVDFIEGELAVLARGLEEGEQVVTDGQAQLRPGAPVQTRGSGGNGGRNRNGSGNGAAAEGEAGGTRRPLTSGDTNQGRRRAQQP
jgi:multidrug efflux system membrane fusion protein